MEAELRHIHFRKHAVHLLSADMLHLSCFSACTHTVSVLAWFEECHPSVYYLGWDWYISTTIGWMIVMKFWTNVCSSQTINLNVTADPLIHVHSRMRADVFSDPLTSHGASSSAQHISLSVTYEQISAKQPQRIGGCCRLGGCGGFGCHGCSVCSVSWLVGRANRPGGGSYQNENWCRQTNSIADTVQRQCTIMLDRVISDWNILNL